MSEYRRYPASQPEGRHAGGAAHHVNKGKQRRAQASKGWRAAFWIALIVFIAAVVALGVIVFSYLQGQMKYQSIAEEAISIPDNPDTSLSEFKVDWEALLAQNPDTVGWIYVPDTVINYPIVHTTNNEKYLTTDFSGDEAWIATYGAIFLAAENKGDFSDQNNIVYGHHMNDGSMFAAIDTFRNSDTFNAHRTVYIFTPQRNYKLTTFALLIVKGDDPLAQTNFATAEQMTAYVQDKLNRSVVTPDPASKAAADMTKIFAFVTCDYTISDGRAVLFASVTDSTAPTNSLAGQSGAS